VLIDAFEREHPEITVELVSGPYNTDDKRSAVRAEIEAGTNPPDVYLGDVIWPAEFGAAGLAKPLDEDFAPGFWKRFEGESGNRPLESSKYDGKIYAVPFYEDRGMLYYRRDLIAERDLPKTWEQLAASAKRLQGGAVRYGFIWQGAPYEGLTCDWLEMYADAGGTVGWPRETLKIDPSPRSPSGVATKFMRDLILGGVTPEFVTTSEEPQATDLFGSGQVAFMRGWNSAYTLIGDKFRERGQDFAKKVGVAPLPTFEGQPSPGYSSTGGWSLFVNPETTEDPAKLAAVKTFIDWMTDLPAQGIMAQFSEIPANTVARELAGTGENANPALAAAVKAKPVYRPAFTPAYPRVSAAIYRNVNAALTGAVPAEAALDTADREADAALATAESRSRPPHPS
jgi:multiple sugar transport system substrate-binding protein